MRGAWGSFRGRTSAEKAVAWTVMAATTVFVFWQMFPSAVFRDTTPAPSDLTAHHGTAVYAQELLSKGRLSGWTMDAFTGYPVLRFYFPLATMLVAALGWLLPLNVALKFVATWGPLTLPLAAYAFGRLNGRDRLTAACLGVATLPMLLEPLLFVPGGSIIAATGSGEYAYGLSLSVAVLGLGFVGAGLRTGRYRAVAAALLAATVVLHVLPAAFAFAGACLMVALHPGKVALRWLASVLGTAVLLSAVWLLPFVSLTRYTGGRTCERVGPVMTWLLPAGIAPIVVLVGLSAVFVIGEAMAGRRIDMLRVFMLGMALLGAVTFAAVPDGQVCNSRMLPMWYLWICLMAGDAVALLARFVDDIRRGRARGRPLATAGMARLLAPLIFLLLVPVVWATRVGPGVTLPSYQAATRIPYKALTGYEGDPSTAKTVDELRAMLRRAGQDRGCGRLHWEATEAMNNLGDQALMTHVPVDTDGCITVLRGMYIESSPATRLLYVLNGRLSREDPDVGEARFDLARGVTDLRLWGVRYFLAVTPGTHQAADRSNELRFLGEAARSNGIRSRLYEVAEPVHLVEPLRFAPVVVPGMGRSRLSWERAAERWYLGGDTAVPLAASGPAAWPRTAAVGAPVERRPLPPTTVTDVRVTDERVSFRVDTPGVPVLVKVSYFPNWKARGARGPWRVTPNQMVVVPTDHDVVLEYGTTAVERLGAFGSLAGIAAVVLLARRAPLSMPERPVEEEVPATPRRAVKKPPKRKPARSKASRRR